MWYLIFQNGDQTNSHFTDKHLEDKAEWAKERLSLQLSLNDAERQIEQQQHDLKIERDRRSTLPSSGVLSDHDKDKVSYNKKNSVIIICSLQYSWC